MIKADREQLAKVTLLDQIRLCQRFQDSLALTIHLWMMTHDVSPPLFNAWCEIWRLKPHLRGVNRRSAARFAAVGFSVPRVAGGRPAARPARRDFGR